MTKTESASLAELGMDEAELQARTAAVSAKINGAAPEPTRTRRTRSDAGKPRDKKLPAIPGLLTGEQVLELANLYDTLEVAVMNVTRANFTMQRARDAVNAYLDEITAK